MSRTTQSRTLTYFCFSLRFPCFWCPTLGIAAVEEVSPTKFPLSDSTPTTINTTIIIDIDIDIDICSLSSWSRASFQIRLKSAPQRPGVCLRPPSRQNPPPLFSNLPRITSGLHRPSHSRHISLLSPTRPRESFVSRLRVDTMKHFGIIESRREEPT
jgi:hypothetical protein